MGDPCDPGTGVRQRTRRAILEAAVSVWARDFSASQGEIADRAAVSRSTLHRYFPDRQTLIEAARADALARIEAECERAVAHATTSLETLEGLLRASVRRGDAVIFLFSDPQRFPDWAEEGYSDPESLEIIAAAQAEGSLAEDLDPQWVLGMFYAVVYTAAEMVASEALSLDRASDCAVRSLLHGVGAVPS